MPGYQDSKASLPLQAALYFNKFYSVALFLALLMIYIYKGVMLPYPPHAIQAEVGFVFAWAVVEAIRLYSANLGNLSELISPLLLSAGCDVAVIIFHSYFIASATYVLRLDQILHGIALAFVSVEAALTLLAMLTFWRAHRF